VAFAQQHGLEARHHRRPRSRIAAAPNGWSSASQEGHDCATPIGGDWQLVVFADTAGIRRTPRHW
jgi:hypothetical protein